MSEQDIWRCDGCCKPMDIHRRYCDECLKAIAERSQPRDCKFCNGKETVHATYLMEGDYGDPYISNS